MDGPPAISGNSQEYPLSADGATVIDESSPGETPPRRFYKIIAAPR